MNFKLLQKILLVFVAILVAGYSVDLSAQDEIILKTGEKVEAQIIEINDVEVKYREYNDPDGIIFTMSRGKIREIRGDKTGIGYQDVPITLELKNHELKDCFDATY